MSSPNAEPIEATVDIRPIAFNLDGAVAYSGLSKTRLAELARDEKIAVRKEGVKNLFERESLDRYIKSLPAYGTTR